MDKFLINPNGKSGKIIFTGIIVLILAAIVVAAYKALVEFKDAKVKSYIDNYASAYGSESEAARKVLSAGAKKLAYTDAKAIKAVAKAAGTDNEYELVHAAYMDAVSRGHLAPLV